MTPVLHIEEKWKGLLLRHGFKDFDSFLTSKKYLEEITSEKNGAVYKLQLPESGEKFYLKIKFTDQHRKVLRIILRGQSYKAPVLNEVDNIGFLQKMNFSTVDIAAWGYTSKMGIVNASFILTEEETGEEFIDLYNRSDSMGRETLYEEYGKLLGLLHINRVDTYVRIQDLLCIVENKGRVKLTMIDREVGSLRKRNYGVKALRKNLSHVFYEGLKRYRKTPITYREGMSFCKAYLKVNKNISLTPKELYIVLMDGFLSFMIKRKSFSKLAPSLPKKFLLWPYLRKKYLPAKANR